MTRTLTIAAALALLAAAPDRPPMMPTRDAAITYRIAADAPGKERQLHVNEQAATGMIRFELQGQPGFALMDLRTGRAVLVIPAQRAYIAMPPGVTGGPRQFLLDPGMKFARTGTTTIAGQDCTLWEVHGPQGAGTICMTAEGLLLRASGTASQAGVKGGLEAVSVSLQPQPADLFTYPGDYKKLDLAKFIQEMQARPPAP